ncbi:hypothetical protein [Cesiribacter sp. SM1]|uniref:hypothetical protein n=1 Tax=Cesiribacter sp. SM1 TaxID=2861196 RepID=UPI001CD71283|nr:hypothetical protein [Cesiribacter sp. SM1]
MEVLEQLIKILLLLNTLLLLAGLWRPVIALWWLDYQNRLRVLRYYGTSWLVLLVLWLLLKSLPF